MPPLARESLDQGTICLGIGVLWCVRLLLTGWMIVVMLGMVFDNSPRPHLCLGYFNLQRGRTGPRPEPTVFTVIA